MAVGIVAKALLFLAFVGLVAASVYGATAVIAPEGLAGDDLALKPVERVFTVQPGQRLDVAVVVEGRGAEAVRVEVTDGAVTRPLPVTVELRGGEGSAWIPLAIPADAAPGSRKVTMTATPEGREGRARAAVTLDVVAPGGGLVEGETAVVEYVGRVADGNLVFNTNSPPYLDAPLAQAEFYRPSTGEVEARTGPGANVIPGFARGIVGMKAGETRTIVIPPADGYGERVREEDADRRTIVERRYEAPVRGISRPFSVFAEHINATKQGDPSSYKPNDTFKLVDGPNTWTFRVIDILGGNVRYVPAPKPGDLFTLPQHEAWKNGSRVVSANDTAIVFETTPTTAEGEKFTFFSYWPGASLVESVDATSIVVRHDPAVGLEFKTGDPNDPLTYTIARLEDDRVVLTFESPNPLSGETLVFNVKLLRVALPTDG